MWTLMALIAVAAGLGTAPAPAQIPHDRSSPTPVPAADKIGARALELATDLQQGKVERTDLADSLNAILDQATLDGYKRELADLGAPTKAVLRLRFREDGDTRYVYRIRFTGATADLTFAIDDATQKISVLFLRAGPPPL